MHYSNPFHKFLIVALTCLVIVGTAPTFLLVANPAKAQSTLQESTTQSKSQTIVVQNFSPIASDEDLTNRAPTGLALGSKSSRPISFTQSTPGSIGIPHDTNTLTDEENQVALLPNKTESRPLAKKAYQTSDTRPFFSDEHANGSFQITCIASGSNYTIWIDSSIRDSVPHETLQHLKDRLPGLIEKEVATFGDWRSTCDIDGDGKVAFILYSFSASSWAGFFDSTDLADPSDEYATGNAMDALHVNVMDVDQSESEALGFTAETAFSTICHEFQHLLFFAQTGGQGESWLDESFSQAAEVILGVAPSDALDELTAATTELGYLPPFIYEGVYVPNTETTEGYAAYDLWMLFARYLAYQTKDLAGGGDDIYQTIHSITDKDTGFSLATKNSLEEALRTIGYLGKEGAADSFNDLVGNFSRAFLLREDHGPYSLTNDPENPSTLDNIVTVPLIAPHKPAASIPGGGALTLATLNNTTNTPDEESVASSKQANSRDKHVRTSNNTHTNPAAITNRIKEKFNTFAQKEGNPANEATTSLKQTVIDTPLPTSPNPNFYE